MQYFQRKYPSHITFIVNYHLKISNIHHILIKLENSYVLDKKNEWLMKWKKKTLKKIIWTPLDPLYPQFWEGSSADSPLKIWDVMTPYLKTLVEQKQKIDNFDLFCLNDPLKVLSTVC